MKISNMKISKYPELLLRRLRPGLGTAQVLGGELFRHLLRGLPAMLEDRHRGQGNLLADN
jgi:hypothetical protein